MGRLHLLLCVFGCADTRYEVSPIENLCGFELQDCKSNVVLTRSEAAHLILKRLFLSYVPSLLHVILTFRFGDFSNTAVNCDSDGQTGSV